MTEFTQTKSYLQSRSLPRRRVLLVGGAGYIGSVMSPTLLDSGYAVTCLDHFVYQNGASVLPLLHHPHYRFVRGDLIDSKAVEEALEEVTDVVLLAGLVGDPITKKYPEASQAINQQGLSHLLDQLLHRSLNRVIFVSTCSNYGLIGPHEKAHEDFELNPLSEYAKAKVQIEKKLLSLKEKSDFTGTVLRFATAFGLSPRMRFDLTVNEFTRDLFLEKELLVYDPHTWRPYCHVLDFSVAVKRVLEAPKERVFYQIFNAGGNENNATKDMLVKQIQEFLPHSKIRAQEHGPDPRNYRVDFTKIEKTLEFRPKKSIRDGIQEILFAFKHDLFPKNPNRKTQWGNYEVFYSL